MHTLSTRCLIERTSVHEWTCWKKSTDVWPPHLPFFLFLFVLKPHQILLFDLIQSLPMNLHSFLPPSVHSSCSDSSSVGSQKEGGSPASGRDPQTCSGSTSHSQVGWQWNPDPEERSAALLCRPDSFNEALRVIKSTENLVRNFGKSKHKYTKAEREWSPFTSQKRFWVHEGNKEHTDELSVRLMEEKPQKHLHSEVRRTVIFTFLLQPADTFWVVSTTKCLFATKGCSKHTRTLPPL